MSVLQAMHVFLHNFIYILTDIPHASLHPIDIIFTKLQHYFQSADYFLRVQNVGSKVSSHIFYIFFFT
jgi:hypothetical protein